MTRRRIVNSLILEPEQRFISAKLAKKYTDANTNSIYNNLVKPFQSYILCDGEYHKVEGVSIVAVDTHGMERKIGKTAKVRRKKKDA